MKKKWFGFKGIAEKYDRVYGLAVRFCGIDVSVSTVWWINDWSLVDLRAFREGLLGVYFQTLGFVIYIGHNNLIWETSTTK